MLKETKLGNNWEGRICIQVFMIPNIRLFLLTHVDYKESNWPWEGKYKVRPLNSTVTFRIHEEHDSHDKKANDFLDPLVRNTWAVPIHSQEDWIPIMQDTTSWNLMTWQMACHRDNSCYAFRLYLHDHSQWLQCPSLSP